MRSVVASGRKSAQASKLATTSNLSEEAMNQHNAIVPLPDDLYVAGLIFIEAAQRHERASYTGKCFKKDLSRSSTRSDSSRSTVTSIEDIEIISQMYRPLDSSSMTPMERFAVLSPANDPCSWESGRMIARIGLEEGSIDMLDVRVDAAIIAEATRKSARFSKLSLAASS